jgi:SAM-dependent methyltransferase
MNEKAQVARFWNDNPCGSMLASGASPCTPEFFERTEIHRFAREPFVKRFAQFEQWKGRRVLEVGCGTGTDLSLFARGGALAYGVDLTRTGAVTSATRLKHYGLAQRVSIGDAEILPFRDSTFDLVYCWGVIHHTPDTLKAASELLRVVRPGGSVRAMIYHRRSLVAAQAYLLYGLLRGQPFRSLSEILANHLESPGTKAYTIGQARNMFAALENLRVTPVITPYDLRIGRNRFLPLWLSKFIPRRLGYFLMVEGVKSTLRSEV